LVQLHIARQKRKKEKGAKEQREEGRQKERRTERRKERKKENKERRIEGREKERGKKEGKKAKRKERKEEGERAIRKVFFFSIYSFSYVLLRRSDRPSAWRLPARGCATSLLLIEIGLDAEHAQSARAPPSWPP
jgi:hypothetical protein